MNGERVIKVLKLNGWFLVRVVGSHHHFKHKTIKGLVTVPVHGKADLHPAIINNLVKMTGCDFNIRIAILKKNLKNLEKLQTDVYTDSNQPFTRQ